MLKNKLQVIKQFEQAGSHANRYDVTILVNGLPLVQVELKKRGVAIREAFNQVHRYSKESFNSKHSLYKFLQLFVISNGTDSRYFANTTKRDKNSFDFTMNWAKADNSLIKDLKDFTATFFQKHTLLEVLLKYSVFGADNTLLVMRPYQIAATERILWKIKSAYQAKNWSKTESGGFIWHTTGSGKTLTSFKAARLVTELDFVDKVFFVVDRKDLDYQTMKEYQRFSPDSVNGSENTAGLKRNMEKDDNKIIVTTIQKLNNLMRGDGNLLHPNRIREISGYIFKNFPLKTHRAHMGAKGFNAMFAVSSLDAAKAYYETFRDLQANTEENKRLKVATIFSFAANEEQDAVGDIPDESFEVSAMNSSAKEFLSVAIGDYNAVFKTNYGVDSKGFQNYYRDLAQRVKKQEVDLLIVVGMFLTGFDAPTLNTLFVDKTLRYHGLLQAFSRTNRIYDATKTFGNIVTFRDLEQSTLDSITLFGNANTQNVVLEKSYKEYMEGFTDIATGKTCRGYVEVVNELQSRFPQPDKIDKEQDKKEFVKLFGEYLRVENVLRNYDEFTGLTALQAVDLDDAQAVKDFKAQYYLSDDDLEAMQKIDVPSERLVQDYRSTYNDTRDGLRRQNDGHQKDASTVDWDDVVFEVDLLKSQEVNLYFILELIFEHKKKTKNKGDLIAEGKRVIGASMGSRAKEGLIVDFINQANLDGIEDKASMIDAFFTFAQAEQKRKAEELIQTESLNQEEARGYIKAPLKREYATENGTALHDTLPKMSTLNPQYKMKKQTVFEKSAAFVEKFKGVGGQL
ncbi:MAG: type I restriction endonuclease subunit R [Candidatus Endonucleobacter bathymodioli]|uniref:Type I restriction enzyme endonuclease subunit n=1 Tax=Candidatus Endonucleibacter bathymodioli TaxID=539814 RepID=A0AA90NTL2_9GAMM|nr:type I restriction endonuclease subunit R [Candidatus Endonucleobacter bathymodioli]